MSISVGDRANYERQSIDWRVFFLLELNFCDNRFGCRCAGVDAPWRRLALWSATRLSQTRHVRFKYNIYYLGLYIKFLNWNRYLVLNALFLEKLQLWRFWHFIVFDLFLLRYTYVLLFLFCTYIPIVYLHN